MAAGTHFAGALVVFGQQPAVGAGTSSMPVDYGTSAGPSLFFGGAALLDLRTSYYEGQGSSKTVYGWAGGPVMVLDAVPAALAVDNISASASPGAGAIVLVTSTAAGITVGVSITNRATGTAVTGLLAIDGSAETPLTYGSAGGTTIGIYDPSKMVARNIRITSGGDDTLIVFTVSGYDVYGYPMSEAITGVNAGIAAGKKAFKYISGITHTGSVATTMSVGTGDVLGFPLRVDHWGQVDIYQASAGITATTGFLAAVTTDPATTTTGDVRGTYALQTASDGTRRTIFRIWPAPANLGSSAGLFGVTQV